MGLLLRMNRFRYQYFHGVLDDPKGVKLCDIGCGGGFLSESFAADGADVYGLDLSSSAVRTARNHAAGGQVSVSSNKQWQDTIVGTDALLANNWAANVTYSADAGNTVDVRDNPVNIRHEDYILIDNNGSLTAVRAGKMQHWRDRARAVEFVETPQNIDVPRAGRLVRFEKPLVRGDDRLVLTATYVKEGK